MGDKKSTDHPSLHPPRHGYYKGDDDASASSPEDKHTSWVLLDLKAYIADRENSTTACAVMTSDGETIQVTFCAAPTPLVSYICVWCPGLRTADMLAMRSSIEAVESDLLLLRVTASTYKANYFIYKANGGRNGGPSLRPIQIPRPCLDLPYSIALLGHRDLLLPSHGEEDDDAAGHYYLAGLSFDSYSRTDSTIHYSFWLFDSKAGKWSKSPVSLHGDVPFHVTTKSIVLRQDGLVGFVDLLRGIIICDVLCHDKPRYLPLPLEAIRRDDFDSEPTLFRDVAVVEGRLTLVELRYIVRPGTNLSCCWTWEVSTWSRKVTPDWEQDDDWRPDYRIQSGDIEVYEGTENVASLLPKLEDGEGNQRPTLERLYTACPVLSLSDKHVVYVMGKVGRRVDEALVLSIDMMRRRLQGVATFDAERMVGVTFSYTCTQSRIPGCLN